MCVRCTAPNSRYFVEDVHTGLFVCEECGIAVADLTRQDSKKSSYIWEFNPEWPVFHTFDELVSHLSQSGWISLPRCRLIPNVPSRLLTLALDILGRPDVH
jgi:hypothetical protein